jgi:replicative superfamily II helicase/DNA-binding winged helix-turn-helix (wHTH) protein
MALPIEHLAALGLSQNAVEAWRGFGIHSLLPLQEKALMEHGFLHGKNLLVFAPTSSGKTFIAEMAALKHLERNRRAVYLVPTKALAEEKFRAFSSLYGAMGYRISISTRERPATDGVVYEGRYDLLVAVYEKMKSYLIARPEMLASVGLVVADEIQTLGEPGRGGTIDLLLTKISSAPRKPQFIGLSAVLGEDAARLAAWLGCDLMVYRERPLELREGVFDCSRNLFHYRCFNTGESGDETLSDRRIAFPPEDGAEEEPPDFRREAIFSLATALAAERHEQVLIFVPTRYVSRNWAHHLAGRLDLPPAAEALEEIARYEDTCSRNLLSETLRQGVAFHNADLSWDLRELIERHFNAGAIRVLVSTSTLGQGVNLSGRNVLHVPLMITTDRWTQRHSTVALTRNRFHNQGGRSARFSRELEFGRSILLAANPTECQRLMRDYIEGDLENLEPQIAVDALDVHVLDLAASRVAVTRQALSDFFHNTFSGRIAWPADSAPVARQVDLTVQSLIHRKLLAEDETGALFATGLGETAAATGLLPLTVERIAAWLREGPRTLRQDPIEALVVLASTPDAREFPLGGAGMEGESAEWVEALRERLAGRAEEGEKGEKGEKVEKGGKGEKGEKNEKGGKGEKGEKGGVAPAVEALLFPSGGFTRDTLQDMRKVLLLDAWIGPGETRDIEERFHVFSGTIANLASHFAWLAQGAAALAKALALETDCRKALANLAEKLVLGCDLAGLRSVRVQGLSRAYVQTLLREGYTTLQAIRDAGEETLGRLIPPRVVQDLLDEAARLLQPTERRPKTSAKRPTPPPPVLTTESTKSTASTESTKSTQPPETQEVVLEVDLRGTGRAVFHGRDLDLPRLAFRLLTILARHPELGVSYEDIERYLWPDAVVERQQVGFHRARIIRKLSTIIPKKEAKALIQVKPGRGLRLILAPHQIRLLEPGA